MENLSIQPTGTADDALTIQSKEVTNTGKLLNLKNSAGTSKFSVADTGNTAVAGTLVVTGAQTANGAINAAAGITVPTGQTIAATDAGSITIASKKALVTWTVPGISSIVTPATSGTAWIAPKACKVVSLKEAHSAGATGVTLNLRKITDTSAPNAAAGATVKELLASALAADSANNTVVSGTLSATAADYTFAAGDRMCWNASGTLTSYVGNVTVEFQDV